jgi:ribonuclease HII
MIALHDEHPGYGWRTNKGYGTEEHLKALNVLGPCVHHRRSFAPVYQILRPVNHEDSRITD